MDHASPGDDFHAFRDLSACDCLALAETGLTNYDDRCPLAWGTVAAGWCRTGHGATATVEAVP